MPEKRVPAEFALKQSTRAHKQAGSLRSSAPGANYQAVIHRARNTVTGLSYVGHTHIRPPDRRALNPARAARDRREKAHLRLANKGGGAEFHEAIREYTGVAFAWTTEAVVPSSEAKHAEAWHIAKHQTLAREGREGYNVQWPIGLGGLVHPGQLPLFDPPEN